LEELLIPVTENLIITQYFDKLYYPAFGINTLGNFSTDHGYVSKMSETVTLPVTGFMADNDILLTAGWNLLPVISTCAVDVTLLDEVDGFVIAWDVAGDGIYYPEYGINTIGAMMPGAAYYVKMENEENFAFPDCSDATSANYFPLRIRNITPWNMVSYTGVAHAVVFTEEAMSEFDTGDVIGVFTGSEKCAGITVVPREGNAGMKAFADDMTTLTKDGFAEGERLRFKAYRPDAGEEYRLDVIFDGDAPDADGLFVQNGLSVVVGLTSSTSDVNISGDNFYIYPNPSTGIFTVETDSPDRIVDLVVVNTKGETVLAGLLPASGQINLSSRPKGIYFVKFITDTKTVIEKIVVR
jgi:hypothetical protein